MAEERKLNDGRRDYTQQIVRAEPAPSNRSPGRPKPAKIHRRQFMLPVIIALLLIVAGGGWTYSHKTTPSSSPKTSSPVPEKIIKSVSFPVYYPDPKRLPAGYILNTNSFSNGDGVVVYSVKADNGKKIAFTVQQRPSDIDIKGFYAAHMPVTVKIQTNLGTANVGTINSLNVYSLPAKDAWLIISTSLVLKDDQIKNLLNSLTIPNH